MTPYVFTAQTLQLATSGIWHNLADVNSTRIITDTRKLQAGDVFLAIVGSNFDGHDFVHIAKEQGAAAIICQRRLTTALPQLIVADTKLALGDLARYRRQSHPNLTVVALTGSSGKTTAKDMLGSILSQVGKTLITKGNLNNDLGVPMTVLELSDDHEFAVFELGANHVGEIAYTVDIVKPDVACVLNVGTAHLGEFGGRDRIAQAKAEIFSTLGQAGIAVVPFDDEYGDFLYKKAAQHTQNILSFGEKVVGKKVPFSADASMDWTSLAATKRSCCDKLPSIKRRGDVFADEVMLLDTGCQFDLQLNKHRIITATDDHVRNVKASSVNVTMSFVGAHNVSNALAVSAIATALGVDLTTIANGLFAAIPPLGRLTHLPLTIGGVSHLLIDDSYNANPTSVLASADVLAAKTGQKILVLGDIAEQGEQGEVEHNKLGQRLAQGFQDGKQIQYLITIGELMSYCHRGAVTMIDKMGLPMIARHFEDKATALNFLASLLIMPSAILLKGSRSQQLETMIDDLQAMDS